MIADGGQCTNFVFTAGSDVLLRYAAHCAGFGNATDTNGCLAGSEPLGTPVWSQGAQHAGSLVYSSWETMLRNGETDANACAFNLAIAPLAASLVPGTEPFRPGLLP